MVKVTLAISKKTAVSIQRAKVEPRNTDEIAVSIWRAKAEPRNTDERAVSIRKVKAEPRNTDEILGRKQSTEKQQSTF